MPVPSIPPGANHWPVRYGADQESTPHPIPILSPYEASAPRPRHLPLRRLAYTAWKAVPLVATRLAIRFHSLTSRAFENIPARSAIRRQRCSVARPACATSAPPASKSAPCQTATARHSAPAALVQPFPCHRHSGLTNGRETIPKLFSLFPADRRRRTAPASRSASARTTARATPPAMPRDPPDGASSAQSSSHPESVADPGENPSRWRDKE